MPVSMAGIRVVPILGPGNSVTLWFGTAGLPPSTITGRLRHVGVGTEQIHLVPDWSLVRPLEPYWIARIPLTSLRPGGYYELHLGTLRKESAAFRVFPAVLPTYGSTTRGFEIVVGSCYDVRTADYKSHDRIGSGVGGAPDLKVLCGDQVYLDLPFYEDLSQDAERLLEQLCQKYVRNWHGESKLGVSRDAFGRFLSRGANLFVADDHEFWNNFPFRQAQLPITWPWFGARSLYRRVARKLFRAFQTSDDVARGFQEFRIRLPGEGAFLSIATLEGRYFRTRGSRAHDPAAPAQVRAWVQGLKGPGVLVFSQPPTLEAAGWPKKKFVDAMLSDYDDFEEIVTALDRSKFDLLFVSGDIHRARYIEFPANRVGRARRSLHEVTSSPLSLMKEGKRHAKGKPVGTRRYFPTGSIRGVAKREGSIVMDGLGQDGYASLHFHAVGTAVRVQIQYWSIPDSSSAQPVRIWPERGKSPHVITLQCR